MKKSPRLLESLVLIPTLAAAFSVVACSSAEMPNSGSSSGGSSGTGNSTGSGGQTSNGSGGSNSSSSGGSSSSGSGGSNSSGSGGSSSSGSGGKVITGSSSGGSTSTGSGGMIITGAGSGGSTGTGTPGALSPTNGFATNGTWMGYAFTATFGTTATISPVCPTPCFTGTMPLCASGTVGADPTFGSGALLGWNVAQAMPTAGGTATVGTVATSGTGVAVTVSAAVTGGRVQIQGATSANTWCANLTGTTAMIPWAMFNTKCWDPPSGTAFTAGTAISAVQIVVPAMGTAVPFNFCLNDAHQY